MARRLPAVGDTFSNTTSRTWHCVGHSSLPRSADAVQITVPVWQANCDTCGVAFTQNKVKPDLINCPAHRLKAYTRPMGSVRAHQPACADWKDTQPQEKLPAVTLPRASKAPDWLASLLKDDE